jgi:hypothetical protein
MLARMSQSIPTQHIAGDSFTARFDGATYSAADGWVAQLVLIGPVRITLNSLASGPDHVVDATAAVTAEWVAGSYAMRAVYTKAATSSRASEDAGTLKVLPDPTVTGTTAASLKSAALVAFETLQTAYRAYLASGSFTVQEYTVNGRRMTYRTVAELLAALNAAARDVEAENAAARIAAGQNPRARFVVRM